MSVYTRHTRLRINDLYRHLVDFEIKFDFVINSQKIKAVNESIHFKNCVPVFILSTAIFYATYMPPLYIFLIYFFKIQYVFSFSILNLFLIDITIYLLILQNICI